MISSRRRPLTNDERHRREGHRDSMTREKKIGLIVATVVAIGGALGGLAALWKKEGSKPIVPTLPANGAANRPNGERIDFRRNTVVVVDVDIRTRVARIAAAVKALPPGALAEIVADVGRREDNGELLARERTKLVKNL